MRQWMAGAFVYLVFGSSPAMAQATGTPSFLSPPPPLFLSNFGLFVSGADHDNPFALEAMYRFVPRSRSFDFGLRAGIGDGRGTGGSPVLAGVDGRYSVVHESVDFPLDGALTAGIGGRFGGGEDIGIVPLGVTFGRRLTLPSGAVQITTYMHPKVLFTFGSPDKGIGFNTGIGFNILFGRGIQIDVGGAVGDFGGVGLGLVLFRPRAPEAPEVSESGGR